MLIRDVKPEDLPILLELIRGLADYEKLLPEVSNTVEKLNRDIFENKYCEAIVAEKGDKIIGFALFYASYSTWKGPCLYLEDLYVDSEMRGLGIGSKLFNAVVSITKERKLSRLEWQILDWNEIAINFYKKKNATLDAEWINGRLSFNY